MPRPSSWARCGTDEECRERLRAKRREQYRRDREKQLRGVRDYQFRQRYGITHDEYDRLLCEQRGRCAICGEMPGRRRLAVDHDHETGNVRGLLCANCNRGLGNFKDDPTLLCHAISYLDRHSLTREYDVDGSTYIPRDGYEEIEPLVSPSA